jgi:hypothetical protein
MPPKSTSSDGNQMTKSASSRIRSSQVISSIESIAKPNISSRNVEVILVHLGLLLELSLRVIAMIRATAVEKLNKTQRRV